MGISHLYSVAGLNTTLLSLGGVLETAPTVEMVGGQNACYKDRKGARRLPLPGSSWQINGWSHALTDLLQTLCYKAQD